MRKILVTSQRKPTIIVFFVLGLICALEMIMAMAWRIGAWWLSDPETMSLCESVVAWTTGFVFLLWLVVIAVLHRWYRQDRAAEEKEKNNVSNSERI